MSWKRKKSGRRFELELIMSRGEYFANVIGSDEVSPGVWDPFAYRRTESTHVLGDFVESSKPRGSRKTGSPFQPVTYGSIPPGHFLSFDLQPGEEGQGAHPTIGEEQLIFGTMRAYLGNVIVTPRAEWLEMESPVLFKLNSEFACIQPKDGLVYFWWYLLRSRDFRESLPLGMGGTRPRLHIDQLLQTPVEVPAEVARVEIDARFRGWAEQEWRAYSERLRYMKGLGT